MLINCQECGNQVSNNAETCPHCGVRVAGRESMVHCPTCNISVLPVNNPVNTISQYCPYCNNPVTNLSGRRGFFVFFFLVIIVIALFGFGILSFGYFMNFFLGD